MTVANKKLKILTFLKINQAYFQKVFNFFKPIKSSYFLEFCNTYQLVLGLKSWSSFILKNAIFSTLILLVLSFLA
jgi:hypothetical protein